MDDNFEGKGENTKTALQNTAEHCNTALYVLDERKTTRRTKADNVHRICRLDVMSFRMKWKLYEMEIELS